MLEGDTARAPYGPTHAAVQCLAGPIANANAWGNVGMAKKFDWFGEVCLLLNLADDGNTDTWNVDVYGLINFPDDDQNEDTIQQFRLKRFIIDGQQDEGALIFDNFGCTHLWIEVTINGQTDTLTLTEVLFARVLYPFGHAG